MELIKGISEKVIDHVFESLNRLAAYPWFISFLNGEFSRDAADHFVNDMDYRNRLASYRLIAMQNYLAQIKEYQNEGRVLIRELAGGWVRNNLLN